MKNIAIFGASRAGKSTLARMLHDWNKDFHIISGDAIRSAFQNELPKNEINKFGGNGMKEDYAKFCSFLLKKQISSNKSYYNYIFDSCDISVANALKYFKDNEIIIVFLGYSKISPEEALKNYRSFEKENDWTTKRTDEELLEHAKTWINNSIIFENECKLSNLKYVDTSFNRNEILKNLFKYIIEECNKD